MAVAVAVMEDGTCQIQMHMHTHITTFCPIINRQAHHFTVQLTYKYHTITTITIHITTHSQRLEGRLTSHGWRTGTWKGRP